MDREAIRAGKKPVEESSPSQSDSESQVPPNRGQGFRSTGGVVIRNPSRTVGPAIKAVPIASRRPTPSPAVSSDPAGPSGIASTVTLEDVEAIRAKFLVPDFIDLSVPEPEDRVTSDYPGRVALYEEFFRCGLRLPFHPFIVNLLDRYRLVPTQLTPNSIRIICAFVVLCHFEGVRPGLSLFRAFYKLRRQGEGTWWSFTARPSRAFPLGLPSKVRGWKARFLFAHVEGVRATWREPDASPNENSAVEDRDRDIFTKLSNCQIPSYKELLSEENLVEAELAPATGELDAWTSLSLSLACCASSWILTVFLRSYEDLCRRARGRSQAEEAGDWGDVEAGEEAPEKAPGQIGCDPRSSGTRRRASG